MDAFAKNLKNRAEELGLSNAEVARRVGLSERRYAHYVSGRNEPDLELLMKIAKVLKSSPNDLLSFEKGKLKATAEETLAERIQTDCVVLSKADLEVLAVFARALADRSH